MRIVPQTTTFDNQPIIFDTQAAQSLMWGAGSELIRCGAAHLPEQVWTRGPLRPWLRVDPGIANGWCEALVARVQVVHLDAPKRAPMWGMLRIADLLATAELREDAAGLTWCIFPASILGYPSKTARPKHRAKPGARRVSRARKAVKRQRATLGGAL